jgi:phosphate transport system protein
MLRQGFEQKLHSLQAEVVVLGRSVGRMLDVSVATLTRQDVKWAKDFLAHDFSSVNRHCAALETEILSLIATQQPVAGDLRNLIAVLEIIAELDHIGQYAASIAQATLVLGGEPLLEGFRQLIPAMADKARAMLNQSLSALEQQDVLAAQAVPGQDDEVDDLYGQICRELVTAVQADPQAAGQATSLSRLAHNLERTADRVINICEWVIFAVTGEMKELNVSAD